MQTKTFSRVLTLVASALVVLTGCGGKPVTSEARLNPLQQHHESQLMSAKRFADAAHSEEARALALRLEAAALDSLGRSEQALTVIDQASALSPEDWPTIRARAGILYSLGRTDETLRLLAPAMAAALSPQPIESMPAGMEPAYDVVPAVFALIEKGAWAKAVEILEHAVPDDDDPGYAAYRTLLYCYIKSRAGGDLPPNETFERQIKAYAGDTSSHYAVLVNLWSGQEFPDEPMVQPAGWRDPVIRQDALAEFLFYGAAYAKYVAKDARPRQLFLTRLNRLKPYGNIEWIHAQRTF